MEPEKLEYKVVMDDGPDIEVLGRVRDLDFAAAVYMAAVAKYPNRNIQLRQGERIIKRHDGEPKAAPPAPVDPNLKSWSVHLIRGRRMEWLGSVDASDETSATQRAIEMFALTEEQRKRLAGRNSLSTSKSGAPHHCACCKVHMVPLRFSPVRSADSVDGPKHECNSHGGKKAGCQGWTVEP
jgi:hypothetical protein